MIAAAEQATNGWDALLGLGGMGLVAFICYGFYKMLMDI